MPNVLGNSRMGQPTSTKYMGGSVPDGVLTSATRWLPCSGGGHWSGPVSARKAKQGLTGARKAGRRYVR